MIRGILIVILYGFYAYGSLRLVAHLIATNRLRDNAALVWVLMVFAPLLIFFVAVISYTITGSIW